MTHAAAVAYNPFEPGFAENPYTQYQGMREHEPVHESPFGIWLLFRYDDVLRFLRDPTLSVEDRNARPTILDTFADQVMGEDRDREAGTKAMINRDPPDHTRLRKLVSKAFTPRRIENLRPRVQELVDISLDRAAETGQMELIGDYAFPLPFAVISEMLGMPPTDTDKLRDWSGTLVRTLEPVVDPGLMHAILEASDHMRALILDVLAWKRKNLSDDLLSGLIAAEEDGDALTDEELLEQVMLLYIAGHETTVNLIGNGTLALLKNRDQLARLKADPSLDAVAVEELLRYDSPVQMTRRITLTDVEIGGKTIPEGVFVVCGLASSNRDQAHWGPTADQVDVTRANAKEHLSFGGGAHYCLGAALARLEAQVAIASLLRRFSTIESTAEPEWNGRLNLRGLEKLPLVVSP
ncbi:MAG: cytochrome P450 [Acidimicrobiia bacterium]|nr:cytochrome P450 [Acidimicrobiia bacterium]